MQEMDKLYVPTLLLSVAMLLQRLLSKTSSTKCWVERVILWTNHYSTINLYVPLVFNCITHTIFCFWNKILFCFICHHLLRRSSFIFSSLEQGYPLAGPAHALQALGAAGTSGCCKGRMGPSSREALGGLLKARGGFFQAGSSSFEAPCSLVKAMGRTFLALLSKSSLDGGGRGKHKDWSCICPVPK
jgi:hypothetical protein